MEQKSHTVHRWAHHKSPNNVQRNYHQSPVRLRLRLHVHVRPCLRVHRGMCVLSQCVYIRRCVTAWRTWLQANISGRLPWPRFNKAQLQIASCISFPSLSPLHLFFSWFLRFPQSLSYFASSFPLVCVTNGLFMSNWPSRLGLMCRFHSIIAPLSCLITELQ